MVKANTTTSSGAILYVDHAKHLTPLALTYHATASRHLTSGRTDVIPPSTSIEVDTAFCPRCLTYCDAASASLGVCQKDLTAETSFSGVSCKDCPICFSPAVISIDPLLSEKRSNENITHLICHYLCGYCQWSSKECSVTSNADELMKFRTLKESDPSKEKELEEQRQHIIVDVSKALERCLRDKLDDRNRCADSVFQSVVDMWSQKEKDEERRRRIGITSTIQTVTGGQVEGQVWSVESLEQSLAQKKHEIDDSCVHVDSRESYQLTSPRINNLPKFSHENVISMERGNTPPTPMQAAAQMAITTTTPRSRSELLPLPVTYRARVSRRCIAEQAAGRTGILIMPKLNPLEGDSSLRAGHGQWYKKDASAVHIVPHVQISTHGTNPSRKKVVALLKVKNPTLGRIRLRFAPPSLSSNDKSMEQSDASFIDKCELENILIDPFEDHFVRAHECSSKSTESLEPTEWVVLENADDPFLDVGKGQAEDPDEVKKWNSSSVLEAVSDVKDSKLVVVARQRDTAWIELVLSNVSFENIDTEDYSAINSYLAVPLEMHIEIGNGSWEASLIKKHAMPQNEMDLVVINFVVVLN